MRTVFDAATGQITIDLDFVAPAQDPAAALAARRETAYLGRAEFLIACLSAEIITEAEAEQAADGSWPSTFDTFLSGMTAVARIEAKAIWSAHARVWRMSPILTAVAANRLSDLTEEQRAAALDVLFGIET